MSAGAVAGIAFGLISVVGCLFAGLFVYYDKHYRERKAPPVPVPIFTTEDAWHEKYYQQAVNQVCVVF